MNQVTFADFQRDWSDLREKLGRKDFWDQGMEKCDAWLAALGHVYLMFKGSKEETRRAEQMYNSITEEYARRAAFIITKDL